MIPHLRFTDLFSYGTTKWRAAIPFHPNFTADGMVRASLLLAATSLPFVLSSFNELLEENWPRSLLRPQTAMAERPVLVGLVPQVVVLDPGDQVAWISDAGNLRVEFDVNRCPFSSNIFQAPAGVRLLSGPARPGTKAATYKYRLWLNDQLVGHGEVILRDK